MKRIFYFIILSFFVMSCSETTVVHLSGIDINKYSVTMTVGETASLTASPLPQGADLGELSWLSSDDAIVKVDSEGVLTAVSQGEATITVSSGDINNICLVSVVDVPVKSITLSQTSVEMIKGDVVNIEAKAVSDIESDKIYSWSSSDEDIVVVSSEGNIASIVALNKGEATVSVRCGDCLAECSVKVGGIPVTEVLLMPSKVELLEGETSQLVAEVLPEDAEYNGLNWASSDDEVVSVDENGLVTALSEGEAKIIVSTGEVSSECEVKVNKKTANIGDFYYSDGTWSSELEEGKTPIGIVFYVGDPGVHDLALRADHPECTNGLVVALDGDGLSSWQSGFEEYYKAYPDYEYKVGDWIEEYTDYVTNHSEKDGSEPDYLNKIMGYNNTRGIEAFNAAPENAQWPVEVVQKVVEYRTKVKAPESSSDWYLPSAKELSLLCSGKYDENIAFISASLGLTANRDLVNSRLELIPGATKLVSFTYWSSTEYRFQTHMVHFFFGTVSGNYKNMNNVRYRCVLAF